MAFLSTPPIFSNSISSLFKCKRMPSAFRHSSILAKRSSKTHAALSLSLISFRVLTSFWGFQTGGRTSVKTFKELLFWTVSLSFTTSTGCYIVSLFFRKQCLKFFVVKDEKKWDIKLLLLCRTEMRIHLGFLRRRSTEASLSTRPKPEEAKKWMESFDALMASKCQLFSYSCVQLYTLWLG